MQLRNSFGAVFVVAALIVFGMPAARVSAHPHVWVTFEVGILYNEDKAIVGFRHKWTFDELYTNFAIQGLDKNNDGQYDREELRELAEVNINSLSEFEYFTFPKVAGQIVKREAPRDYYLEYTNDQLTLHFTLPLATPIPADKIKEFSLAIYDPTYYVDFAPAQTNPVNLTAAPQGCVPIINNPPPTTVQSLNEAFFSDPAAAANLAAQFAKTISITCPAT